jgi:hypothetical protein
MKLTNNLSFESTLQMYESFYNYEYSDFQKKQLEFGYEDNLDISKYANPEFNYLQMNFIRNGLVRKLDVDKYSFVEYNEHLMDVIYRLLTHDANFDSYVNGEYLDLDALIHDYALLCKRKGLMPIDEWGLRYIFNHAPYRVYY